MPGHPPRGWALPGDWNQAVAVSKGEAARLSLKGTGCRCWEVRHLVAVSGRVWACVHRREESGRWEQGAWAQLSVGTKAHH